MNNNVNMLKAITSVYELSLSIGTSLDLKENCLAFLQTLNIQMELVFSAFWLRENDSFQLVVGEPHFRIDKTTLDHDNAICDILHDKDFFSIASNDKDFSKFIHEKSVTKGCYAFFRIGDIGFLKLYDIKRTEPYSIQDLTRLVAIIEKLRISLEGSIAYHNFTRESAAHLKAKEELLTSSLRYKDLFENMYDALLVTDAEGKLISVNQAGRKILGITDQPVDSITIGDLVHPEDSERSQKYINKLIEEGFYNDYEGRIVTLNNEVRWVQVNSNAIRKNGVFAGSRDLVRDITDKKKAEQQLALREAQLRQIFNTALDAIITIDHKAEVVEWNKAAEIIFGYTAEEALGRKLTELIIPERYAASHIKGMRNSIKTGEGPIINQRIEITALRKNGEEFPVELSVTAFDDEGSYKFNSFIRDLTEQKKAEANLKLAQDALKISEEKYRGIIENMELGLLEVNTEGKITRTFDQFCGLTGFSEVDLINKDISSSLLLPEYRDLIKTNSDEKNIGQSAAFEAQIYTANQEPIWVLVSKSPIHDPNGNLSGKLIIFYDLSAQKELEKDLSAATQEAESARVAEQQFLANMSHEIRTPMNAVIGMTNLLYKTNPTTEQKELLDVLGFSADNLMGLIDNILDLSKIEAGKIEFEEREVHLQKLLYNLKLTFQFKVKDKPISVVLDYDPKIKNYILADPTRLNQVLFNLLGNASKFTERGTIGIKVDLIQDLNDSYLLRFQIHDTGIGISQDKISYIFDSFKQADIQTTRKYGGTGLGLTIVKQLVGMQGGSISVESTLNEGSKFTILLPFKYIHKLALDDDIISVKNGLNSSERLRELKILIVEDNAMNQMFIQKVLDIWETTYVLAKNGMEALELSRKQAFDIILMDIHMPEMDGIEATKTIRKEAKNKNYKTPIIALTAAALMQEKKRALDAGMNSFLTKPFSPKMLQTILLEQLDVQNFNPKEVEKPKKREAYIDDQTLIDLTYLSEFCSGDQRFIRDMLQTYLKESAKTVSRLIKALHEDDWEKVYNIVHKLKPSFTILGMHIPESLAKNIQIAIKQPPMDKKKVIPMVRTLAQFIKKSIPEVKKYYEAV